MQDFPVSIDWLTIREPNRGRFPVVNGGCVVCISPDGEVVYSKDKNLSVRGSYDSHANIRVTEDERWIDFNPSRWNRADNVFGLSWVDALAMVDVMLAEQGQPGVDRERPFLLADGSLSDAAVVTRLDVNVNVMTGSPEEAERYLRGLAGLCLPKLKPRVKGDSVYWGKRVKWFQAKAYDKGNEILRHLPQSSDPDYAAHLGGWCKAEGVVRLEFRYGRDWLRDHGLRSLSAVSDDVLRAYFSEGVRPMLNEVKAEDVAKLSRQELGTLAIWLRGYDVRAGISDATYYRHRAAIKKATGYDIATDLRIWKHKPKKFNLRPAVPPAWYRHPEIPSKKLAEVE